MYIQVAKAGVLKQRETDPDLTETSSAVYYEPGYNITNELDFTQNLVEGEKPSAIYFYFRERSPYSSFLNIFDYNYNIYAIDAYTGQPISSYIDFSAEIPDPYLGADIGLGVIDLSLVESHCIFVRLNNQITNNDIFFKIFIKDNSISYSYLQIDNINYNNRPLISASSTGVLVSKVAPQGSYILIAPYAMIKETNNASLMDFAYPNSRVMYQRYNITTDDEYVYEVDSFGRDYVARSVDIFNVPNYSPVGVVVLGAELYNRVKNTQTFFRIKFYGKSSQQEEFLYVQLLPYKNVLN